MFDFTFLRHGESTGNVERIIQGQSDCPLTEKGLQQAKTLADSWTAQGNSFDLVITSSLARARQTAEIIAGALHTTLEVDPIWVERSFGQLEGLLLSEIEKIQPPIDYYHPYLTIGTTGESQTDLYLRASRAIQSLLCRPPGCYLIVSHGAMLNKVFYAIFGITPASHYNSPVFPLGNMAFASISYNPETRQWLFHSLVNQPVDHPVYTKFVKE